jgi:transposase
MDLTDAQWQILEPIFRPRRRPDGRGRPWQDTRGVVNGVLWVLRTGAPWHDLPGRYPPYQTCHRRFQAWQRTEVLRRLLTRLAEDLRDRGKLDLSEAFIDASFSSAKKGAPPLALLDAVRAGSGRRRVLLSAAGLSRTLFLRACRRRHTDHSEWVQRSDQVDPRVRRRTGHRL